MSLMQLSMIFVMVTMADESARRINEVLEATPTIKAPAEPIREVADGSIDFDGVSFKYSARAEHAQALSGIDLHIKSGETIGIMGGTGSAKSSLVQPHCRGCTTRPRDRVRVGGVDVRDYDLEHPAQAASPWCCRKTCCSPAPSRRTCAGADADATDDEIKEACATSRCADEFVERLPQGLRHLDRAGWHRTSPAARSSACASRARC